MRRVEKTVDSMQRLSREVEERSPESIVIVSPPHIGPLPGEGFGINTAPTQRGSFARFGAPGVVVEFESDIELANRIAEEARGRDLPVEEVRRAEMSDWGAMVPLRLLAPAGSRIVSITVSPYLSYGYHFELGRAIRQSIDGMGGETVFIASGDMSHRLTRGAPSGYSPRGAEFDSEVEKIISGGDFTKVMDIDPGLVEAAGEDCLWSVSVLGGVVEDTGYRSRVLSYEGPFGVGYLVAEVVIDD